MDKESEHTCRIVYELLIHPSPHDDLGTSNIPAFVFGASMRRLRWHSSSTALVPGLAGERLYGCFSVFASFTVCFHASSSTTADFCSHLTHSLLEGGREMLVDWA
ncbi:unnamed protein product [Taenia asiatica]|uniref:Uncharacterized protein n=1 Tax=Taenia asiatica TaxID=60517 RepID=A0A0R3VYB6_TAEAS|nr:unnamed protein product [Taenia asiatica]